MLMFEMYNQVNDDSPAHIEWRWQLVQMNGHIVIANSSKPFKSKKDCEANIHLVMLSDMKTPIVKLNSIPNNEILSTRQ